MDWILWGWGSIDSGYYIGLATLLQYNLIGPIGKLNINIDDRLGQSLAISAGCTMGELGVGGLTIKITQR